MGMNEARSYRLKEIRALVMKQQPVDAGLSIQGNDYFTGTTFLRRAADLIDFGTRQIL
jgi:hypothetical protein